MSNNPYKRTTKVDVIGDLPGADQARNLLRIGHVAQDVTLETRLYEAVDSTGDPSVRVEPTSGSFDVEQADPVALEGDDGAGTYGEVYRRGNALRASLEADEVGLATESSLTSEQAREVATWSAGTLDVEQQSPVAVEDSSGGQVDPATEGSLTSEQPREVSTWSAGTLSVEQQSPVGVEDSSGGQVDPASETTLGTVESHLNNLDSALQSQATEVLRVDLESNNAGTLSVEQQSRIKLEADDDDGNTHPISAENLSQGNIGGAGLLTYLARALQDHGHDQLRVDIENESADLATETTLNSVNSNVDFLNDALQSQANDVLRVDLESNNAGTLAVEPQSPVAVEDTAGTQVDPAVSTDYLDHQTAGHDLAGGDLTIGAGAVERGAAVIIAATSTDDNAFSISVDWVDGNGNTYQSESAADIGLDSITEDYARLVRKAPQIEVTVTDESGAAQNLVNVHVDTER
jgi:hypothetical protein